MHYLLSTSYCLMWCQISCYTTHEPRQHSTPTVVIARTDDFLRGFVCGSWLDLGSNQLQQLPPGVFSNLTSLRSLTCVVECIENVCVYSCVWLPSIYDPHLKTKVHFKGRVNNNACEQSCTTFCQLYIASAPCTLMVTIALLACVYACWYNHKSNANWGSTILKHTSTQAVLILCGDVCHLDYARWWSYITSVTCGLMTTKAFLVSRWSLNNSSA